LKYFDNIIAKFMHINHRQREHSVTRSDNERTRKETGSTAGKKRSKDAW